MNSKQRSERQERQPADDEGQCQRDERRARVGFWIENLLWFGFFSSVLVLLGFGLTELSLK